MNTTTLKGVLLATTLLGASAASAQQAELIIESWRNDDLAIWQDKIIPAFEAEHPDIKVKFTPSAPAEYNAVLMAISTFRKLPTSRNKASSRTVKLEIALY